MYVSFKIVIQNGGVFLINWNTEKNTTLNTDGLERGTRSTDLKITEIFHFT